MRVKSLGNFCHLELMKNPRFLENVSNVPYRLLSYVFEQINIGHEQLHKLEMTNIFFIFEDDALWKRFLIKEFPINIHESFISNKDPIVNYYMSELQRLKNPLDDYEIEIYKSIVKQKLKKDPTKNKYQIPYRKLFFQYQSDAQSKQEQSAERLRKSMEKINQERQKKQTITVDYSRMMQNQRGSNKRRHVWEESGPTRNLNMFNDKSNIVRSAPSRIAFGGLAGAKASIEMEQEFTQRKANNSVSSPAHSPNHSDQEPQSPTKRLPIQPTSRRNKDRASQNIFLNNAQRKKFTLSSLRGKPHKQTLAADSRKNQLPHPFHKESKLSVTSNNTTTNSGIQSSTAIHKETTLHSTKKKTSSIFHKRIISDLPQTIHTSIPSIFVKTKLGTEANINIHPNHTKSCTQQSQTPTDITPTKKVKSLKNYLNSKRNDNRTQ